MEHGNPLGGVVIVSGAKETLKLARYWVERAKEAKQSNFPTAYWLCIENAEAAIKVLEGELGGVALRKELEQDGYTMKKGK
jgi:hypothetical protein